MKILMAVSYFILRLFWTLLFITGWISLYLFISRCLTEPGFLGRSVAVFRNAGFRAFCHFSRSTKAQAAGL